MSDTAKLITVGPKSAREGSSFTAERFGQVMQMIMMQAGIVFFENKDELLEKKQLVQNKQQPWAPETHQIVKITIETCEYSEDLNV